MQFDPTLAFGKNITAAMTAGHPSGDRWIPSPLMAVHAWWTHPVWYNLIFGVGEVQYDVAATPPTLKLSFNRGGHQSSQGAASLQNWWAEGDVAFLDTEGEWFHDAGTETLHYAPYNTTTGSETLDPPIR